MKCMGFLLALMMLFLSVHPALAVLKKKQTTECAGGCCEQEEEIPVDSEPTDDACGSQCNPLLTCSTCGGYLSGFFSFDIATLLKQAAKPIPASQRVYSQFSPEFWQPPKLS